MYFQQNKHEGCSKRSSNKAAGESKPEAYPPGYVEDFDETRTQREAVFNIRHTVSTIFPKNLRESICSCAARASFSGYVRSITGISRFWPISSAAFTS